MYLSRSRNIPKGTYSYESSLFSFNGNLSSRIPRKEKGGGKKIPAFTRKRFYYGIKSFTILARGVLNVTLGDLHKKKERKGGKKNSGWFEVRFYSFPFYIIVRASISPLKLRLFPFFYFFINEMGSRPVLQLATPIKSWLRVMYAVISYWIGVRFLNFEFGENEGFDDD